MYQKQRTTKSYSITSPYMQLLQSKKKVYGLKYHSNFGHGSNTKSNNNHNGNNLNSSSIKGRPASSSQASHHNKSNVKSNSSQKVKSTKSQNPKKKRIYTQQAEILNQLNSDPKLHQSLFVNLQKEGGIGNKSLFYNNPTNNLEFIQAKQNNYMNNYDFLKKFSQFNVNIKEKQNQIINFSGSKSQKSNKSAKSKGKGKTMVNNYNRSINFDTVNIGKSIQQLGLTQVQDIICLIDNCLQQANQYISFLASKVQSLKNQLMKCKAQQFQLQRIIKQKNYQIDQKDSLIIKLKKQIDCLRSQKLNNAYNSTNSNNSNQQFKTKQMKKILQVLNEMNQQNNFLQSKVKSLQKQLFLTKNNNQKQQRLSSQEQQNYEQNQFKTKLKEKRKNSTGKDIYNQIHSKIDILNISIDNKKSTANNYSINQNQNKNQKKFKFIKPKNK